MDKSEQEGESDSLVMDKSEQEGESDSLVMDKSEQVGESDSLVMDKSEQEGEIARTCLGPSTHHLRTVEKSSILEEQGPQQQQPQILTSIPPSYPIKDVHHIEQQHLERSDHSGVTQGQQEVLPIQHIEQERQTVVQDHPGALECEAKVLVGDVQEKHKHDQGKSKEQPDQQTCQNEPKKDPSDKRQVKQKQEQPTKKQKSGFAGENYQRINYLVQASRALVTLGKSDFDSSDSSGSESESESESVDFDRPLASQTGSLATAVGRRCLIRLTPSLKRMLCKGCGTALIFGVNARVRHRSNRQKHMVITCLTCNTIKRFVSDPKHKLWCDQEEALV